MGTHLGPIRPLSDESAEREDSMLVGGVGPGRRRDGDEVVAEVDEGIDEVPVVEVVVLHCLHALDEAVHLVPTHHVMADNGPWLLGVLPCAWAEWDSGNT